MTPESVRRGPLDFLATTASRESGVFPAFLALTVSPACLESRAKRDHRVHQDHGAVTVNPASEVSQEHQVSKDTRA